MSLDKEKYSKEQLKDTLNKLLTNIGDVWGVCDYLDDEESDDDVLFEKAASQLAEEAYEKVLENMCFPPFMTGSYPDGSGMFEHEFLYQPACLIYQEVNESVAEGFDIYFMDEVWILANGECAHVDYIWFKMGDFDLHYRRLMGNIGENHLSPIDSESLIWGIQSLVHGNYDEEVFN